MRLQGRASKSGGAERERERRGHGLRVRRVDRGPGIRDGERIALGCCCDETIYCDAGLVAQDLAARCGLAVSCCW